MEMSGSSLNFGTEQNADIEMTDAPQLIMDIEMTNALGDRNAVSSEDGINQSGRGRLLTSSAEQGNLYNSSDAMYRSGESIPHGQDGPTSVVSNRGGYVTRSDDARPIYVYRLGPQELTDFNAILAAGEHQCSPGLDGEDIIPVDADGYECEFCKACEDYNRTAGQNNVHWYTVLP
ncbi:hypothetical protein FOC4_g10007554 [Fusarium odoratissimum]|uniref:Uncharacterized protein n=1 Tax=Fusarium oxysporum f. sp. cubense (strain race 4) TaxID=2502994 RepID=N1RE33_FUSC4|nr:hypothetical protein FOC4_g10007554 [Fusarium odoratissimum]